MEKNSTLKRVIEMESTTKLITENPDSIEIGTPSKGGCIKIYGNFSDKEAFKAKIDNAAIVRTHAQEKLGQ